MFLDINQSDLSGTGLLPVQAFQTVTVNFVAKDDTGTPIGTGGETIIIEIHNECTLDSSMVGTEVTGAKQVLSSPIVDTMTDNGDGTYTYDYSVDVDGTLSVFVYQENYISGIYYENIDWTGRTNTKMLSDLSASFSAADFPDGVTTDGSLEGFFNITIPTSEEYMFTITQNDAVYFYIGKTFE